METRELSIALREMARVQGAPLCDKWYSGWKDDTDVDELLDMYVRGFDFACENDYPPLDFIRRNFHMEDLHRHNIYIDESVSLNDVGSGYYIFLGRCRAAMTVSGLKAVTVYCRHDSVVDVLATDGARVFVTYYDASTGRCAGDDFSKVKTFKR